MHGCKSILAIVPARSGSKGIPNKNMYPLAGISLIGRAAICLAQLPWIDASVISTDSSLYAQEAIAYGLDAPFQRPPELSKDTTGAIETMQHALLESESHYRRNFDVILIIEPTSPLRNSSDITACVDRLLETNADSVVTVSPVDSKYHPAKLLKFDSERHLQFFQVEGATLMTRQSLLGRYCFRNGVCYAVSRNCLMDKGTIIGPHTEGVVIERPIVNVDDPLELRWAEFLLAEGIVPDPCQSKANSLPPPRT